MQIIILTAECRQRMRECEHQVDPILKSLQTFDSRLLISLFFRRLSVRIIPAYAFMKRLYKCVS